MISIIDWHLDNIPAKISVYLKDRTIFFQIPKQKGMLFDQKHNVVWDFMKQTISINGIDFQTGLCYTPKSCPELTTYFGTLMYGENDEN